MASSHQNPLHIAKLIIGKKNPQIDWAYYGFIKHSEDGHISQKILQTADILYPLKKFPSAIVQRRIFSWVLFIRIEPF